MQQEPNNLVFGLVISLLSALLTIVLSSAFQWMKENRNRQWMIEDRKYQRRLDVLALRLKEAENYINQYFNLAQKLLQYEFRLIIAKTIDTTKSYMEEIKSEIGEISRNKTSILNMDDEELNKLSVELLNNIARELDIITLLEQKVMKASFIDVQIETTRANDFYKKIENIRKDLIKRIDHLSGFQN